MGPLNGLRVLDVGYGGPATFAAMVLADLGADVVRVDRPNSDPILEVGRLLTRGQRSVCVDLKHADGPEVVMRLIESADALVEGYRPGVTERLGIGPEQCFERNPALVYGRLTGWGQEGPYSHAAGHDINYIAMAGALDLIGDQGQPPTAPPTLVGDFGGGGMLLAIGVLAGLLHARATGEGQVVDAAMVDGAALLTTVLHGMRHIGMWGERGTNLLDGAAPFYDAYQTADGRYVSIGALEAKFYDELLRRLDVEFPTHQMDPAGWPAMRERFTAIFKSKTLAEWEETLGGTDVCFAPVVEFGREDAHPHNATRGTFVEIDGVRQPGPAPRFSRTPSEIKGSPPQPGMHTDDVLHESGFGDDEIAELRSGGVVR